LVISRSHIVDLTSRGGVGSRQDQEPLPFSTVPGRRVPLPETTAVSDYFNIFIKDDDFEEIAIETNRYAEQYFENNQNPSFSLSLSANIS
jgi:hypothetical protein